MHCVSIQTNDDFTIRRNAEPTKESSFIKLEKGKSPVRMTKKGFYTYFYIFISV